MSKISLDPVIEKKFVEAAQADPEKFSYLYEHYHQHIRRFFAVKLRQPEVIDDLAASTFEKALKNIKLFKWQGYSFSAWLYRIAHNTLVDYFRSQAKSHTSIPDGYEAADDAPSAQEQLVSLWEADTLQNLLKELPAKERNVVYMKFFDGYSNKLIAERTGLSETNVGTILHRAVSKLREAMRKQ